jgi:hypothetical protein
LGNIAVILGRCEYKDHCGPHGLSLDRWMQRSGRHLRLFPTPPLSRDYSRCGSSPYNGTVSSFWLLFLLSHLWLCGDVSAWSSRDSGIISSALLDGNCCSFVLCPATSRLPSCHLCHSHIQWQEWY